MKQKAVWKRPYSPLVKVKPVLLFNGIAVNNLRFVKEVSKSYVFECIGRLKQHSRHAQWCRSPWLSVQRKDCLAAEWGEKGSCAPLSHKSNKDFSGSPDNCYTVDHIPRYARAIPDPFPEPAVKHSCAATYPSMASQHPFKHERILLPIESPEIAFFLN